MAAVAGSIPTNAIKLMHIVIRVDVLLTLAAAADDDDDKCSLQCNRKVAITHTHTGGHTLLMIMIDKCAPSSAYVTLLSNIESYQQLNRKAAAAQVELKVS